MLMDDALIPIIHSGRIRAIAEKLDDIARSSFSRYLHQWPGAGKYFAPIRARFGEISEALKRRCSSGLPRAEAWLDDAISSYMGGQLIVSSSQLQLMC